MARSNFYTPGLQAGMTGGGYQEPIGLLPQHDVLYLTCDSMATLSPAAGNCSM